MLLDLASAKNQKICLRNRLWQMNIENIFIVMTIKKQKKTEIQVIFNSNPILINQQALFWTNSAFIFLICYIITRSPFFHRNQSKSNYVTST